MATVTQSQHQTQGDLDCSLTAMDWLPQLSVGSAMAVSEGKHNDKINGGHTALRKSPNSPLDTNAMLDHDGQQRDGKPPYSYANMITFAVNSTDKKKMTLSEIYSWICDNFPFYKDAGNGWKVGMMSGNIYLMYTVHYNITYFGLFRC